MNTHAREQFSNLFWIVVSVSLVWFFVEAHWTAKAALTALFLLVSVMSYGDFLANMELRETVNEAMRAETSALESRIDDLEDQMEALKKQQIRL